MSSYADPQHSPAGDWRLLPPTRGLPASGFPDLSLFFTELVYCSFRISVHDLNVYVSLSSVFFQKYIKILSVLTKIFSTLIKFRVTLIKVFYSFIME